MGPLCERGREGRIHIARKDDNVAARTDERTHGKKHTEVYRADEVATERDSPLFLWRSVNGLLSNGMDGVDKTTLLHD